MVLLVQQRDEVRSNREGSKYRPILYVNGNMLFHPWIEADLIISSLQMRPGPTVQILALGRTRT
jgi:hypothetical protein